MSETQPLLSQPQTTSSRFSRFRPRLSLPPANTYYVIPLCVALGVMVGMTQAPLVQFVVGLVCNRNVQSLWDTFHIPNTAVTTDLLMADRPREQCEADPLVQALSSRVILVIQFGAALTSLCTTGFYSALSDKKGRRLVFAINAAFFALESGCDFLFARNAESLPIAVLFCTAILQGIGGGASTVLMGTHAYSADTVSPQRRNIIFGRLIAALFTGMFFGPALGGFIMEKFGNIQIVYLLNFIIFTTWLLVVIFILPESNKNVLGQQHQFNIVEESTSAVTGEVEPPKVGILAAFSIIFVSRGPGTSRFTFPALVIAHWFMMMQAMGIQTVIVLSATYRFHWTPANIGAFLSTTNAARLIGLLGLLPLLARFNRRLVKRRGERKKGEEMKTAQHITFDLFLVRFGLGLDAIALLLQGLAKSGWTMYVGVIFQSSAVVYAAAIKSLVLHLVPPEQAGSALGAIAMVEASGHLAGPVIMGTAYSAFVKTNPSMPFYVATAGLFIGFGLVCYIKADKPTKTRTPSELETDI